MIYLRVRNDFPPFGVLFGILALIGCSSQEPAFQENTTKTARPALSERSADALEAGGNYANAGEKSGTGESNPLVPGAHANQDGDSDSREQILSGDTPAILIDGQDQIEAELLEKSMLVAKTEKTLSASERLSGETKVAIAQPRVDRYTLTRQYNRVDRQFQQLTRETVTNFFQQGFSGNATSDFFTQTQQTGVLDVLIVVDTSGSMGQEQNNLSTKLQPLLSFVQDSDWRIGVVTTDPNQGCMRAIINKSDHDYEQKFQNAIQAGINGSGNERGILMAVEGLKGECLAGTWLRANSTLAVLLVSDEDNCSNGSGCNGLPWQSANYLVDHLNTIRNAGDDARVYGLFWHPSLARSECNTAAYQANIYATAVEMTNGTWGTICEDNYSTTLQAISHNIGTILKNQFALSRAPQSGSIEVLVDGVPTATGWSVSGNVITFDAAPANGAAITVAYRYGATPINSSFVLNQTAASDAISIEIDGTKISNDHYEFNAPQNRIDFHTPPPDHASIAITYKKHVDFLTVFDIGQHVAANSVVAKLDGASLQAGAYSYSPASGFVALTQAPPEGSHLEISYLEPGDAILVYPYVPNDGQTEIEVIDAVTRATISATYDQGQIRISPEEFAEGRIVEVQNPSQSVPIFVDLWYDVGADAVPGSAALTIGDAVCSDIVYEGGLLGIDACALAGLEESSGSLTYEYFGPVQHRFVIDPAFFEQDHAYQIWQVYINNELYSDFTLEGSTVEISDLEADAEIQIIVSLVKSR